MRVTTLQSGQAIPVYLEVVRMLGNDHITALYYRQLVFYDEHSDKDRDGYFEKSKPQVFNDTLLSRFKQDQSRLKLMARGWIDSKGKKFKILRPL